MDAELEALIRREFNRYAVDGYMGDPRGFDSYGYLRVSTEAQAEENRSGLPRQIEHCHQVALDSGIRIGWDMIYVDDDSGFVLERPGLQALLKETCNGRRRADYLTCEHLDRLSRNVDWHQGWLLEQFEKVRHMQVIFWKKFSSRIERVVMGSVAQDGMERSKDIMREGMRKKAQRGNLTVKSKTAFGYLKTDTKGNPISDKNRRDTFYTPDWGREDQNWIELDENDNATGTAWVMVWIYNRITQDGMTLNQIARKLNEMNIPCRNAKRWEASYLWQLVTNPVYKGRFAACRWGSTVTREQLPDGTIKKHATRWLRPEEEWIWVDCPAIVNEEVWEQAQRLIARNKQTSLRNAKNGGYLLSGLLKCATCGFTVIGYRNSVQNYHVKYTYTFYRCHTARSKKVRQGIYGHSCDQGLIRTDTLDKAVWNFALKIIYHPDELLQYLDEQYLADGNQQKADQIDYLRREIEKRQKSDANDRMLLDLGAYDAKEYAERHIEFKRWVEETEKKIQALEENMLTPEKLEMQKRRIYDIARRARQYELMNDDTPFEFKRMILKLLVNVIYWDQKNKIMRIEGDMGVHIVPLDKRDPDMGVENPDTPKEGGDNNGIVEVSSRSSISSLMAGPR